MFLHYRNQTTNCKVTGLLTSVNTIPAGAYFCVNRLVDIVHEEGSWALAQALWPNPTRLRAVPPHQGSSVPSYE